jgi:hypothetical protein
MKNIRIQEVEDFIPSKFDIQLFFILISSRLLVLSVNKIENGEAEAAEEENH